MMSRRKSTGDTPGDPRGHFGYITGNSRQIFQKKNEIYFFKFCLDLPIAFYRKPPHGESPEDFCRNIFAEPHGTYDNIS